jgi:hypothetical protein
MRRSAGQLLVWSVVSLAMPSALAQLADCYAGFDISQACISQRGLNQKVTEYQRKITEAMLRLGASYKVSLRPVNNPIEGGYSTDAIAEVFTEVIPNEEMRNQSFLINVTTDFLENQPELLFEASSLHEICHIMNDDLTGYHRNGANVEVAEEHCVLQAVGEERYEQYLRAYANYRHWDSTAYDGFLQKVKELVLIPPQREIDDADRCAADYFRKHPGDYEHLVVFNGELHDASLYSTKDSVWLGAEKLKPIIRTGKPLIFFHNHPAERGGEATFPSHDDFGAAGLISFMVYAENPDVPVEFRVMQGGKVSTSVSYGFKTTALEDIKKVALEYRKAVALKGDVAQIEMKRDFLDYQLAQDSFQDYLQHVCPADHAGKHPEPCMTLPRYFIWPSERFFVHDRPQ